MKKPKPAPWPWFVVGLILAGGCLTSPWTAARRVDAFGVPKFDEQRVEDILQSVNGVPWKLVNINRLLSKVEAPTYVDHATYEPKFLGRGELTVSYREPVARVAEHPNLYIDENGQVFSYQGNIKPMPSLVISQDSLMPLASITTASDLAGAGQVAKLLTARLPNYAWKVELDPRSVIFLSLDKGVKVILGSSEKPEAKINRLAQILTQNAELRQAKEINLTVPNQPTYRL